MSYRDRLSKPAIGIAAFATIVLLALGVGELVRRNAILQELSENIKRSQSSSENTPAHSFNPSPLAINDQADSSHYKPDCSKEQHADLCAQSRMADAAEWQAIFTEGAFYLLVLTFAAAAWAAWEARKGAKAANDTVDQVTKCAAEVILPSDTLTIQTASVHLENLETEIAFISAGSIERGDMRWKSKDSVEIAENLILLLEQGKLFIIRCTIMWMDVFNGRQEIDVGFVSQKLIGTSVKPGRKIGKLNRQNLGIKDHPNEET